MVEIRELLKSDQEALKRFFLSLSDETVFNFNHFNNTRLGGNVNTETAADVQSYMLVSEPYNVPDNEKVWVAWKKGYGEPDDEIIALGLLHFSPDKPTPTKTCSLGLVVTDAYQGKGLGMRLMGTMIGAAALAGMRKIWLQTYAGNDRSITLYKKFGFKAEGVFFSQEFDGEKPLAVVSMGLIL